MRAGNEIGVLLEIQSVGSTFDAVGSRRRAEIVRNLKDITLSCLCDKYSIMNLFRKNNGSVIVKLKA